MKKTPHAPHPPKNPHSHGVLLVNLGTPEAPTPSAVRRYLAEFLNDKRVIDLPRWQWWPILFGPVLAFRPPKVAKAYARIWNHEHDESPLKTITRTQSDKLQTLLGENHTVAWAMRYGHPSIQHVMQGLADKGVTHLTVVPLYPQYAGATTGSVLDAVGKALPHLPWVPALKTVAPYYDHPAYIDALAHSAQNAPDVLICSFHGLPRRYLDQGDPYYCHCHKTARLLAEKLGRTFVADWRTDGVPQGPCVLLTFQSRFGPEEWLQPYSDKTFEALPAQGVADIAVMTPGFAADCLETLDEIGNEGREEFEAAGGKHFTFIPCLNEDDAHIKLLAELVKNA